MASHIQAEQRSPLLSLPLELRTQIFRDVLSNIVCQRPVIIWDDVFTSISGKPRPIQTAILQTCRTTYIECVPILYDVRLSVIIRSDIQDDSFPRFQNCLGSLNDCAWLSRLRHIELEIKYSCRFPEEIARISDRVHKFAVACLRLQTMDLTFVDVTARRKASVTKSWAKGVADPIVEACYELECERVVAVHRNFAAQRDMGSKAWRALTEMMLGRCEPRTGSDCRGSAEYGPFEHVHTL
ncbi:hypothetical protein BDY17DRAFT_304984, partial [Neohortaea acidophila]